MAVALTRPLADAFNEAAEALANEYLLSFEIDRARPSAKAVIARIDEIMLRTEALLKVLPQWTGKLDDGQLPQCEDHVELVSGLRLFEISWDAPVGYCAYDEIEEGLTAFRSNLGEVRQDLEAEAAKWKGSKSLDAFDVLVGRLELLCMHHAVKVSARSDSDKSRGRASPFVELLWLIQSWMPPHAQVYRHSKDGMAKAIQAARARFAEVQSGLELFRRQP